MPVDEASTPLADGPAAHQTALLVIDMLSDWRFPDAEPLLKQAQLAAPRIAALKARCKAMGIPTVYVNDNQGRWRSDCRSLVQEVLQGEGAAADICRALQPESDDYFVLKPKHSGFYETPLHLLLQHLHVTRLIITGVSTEHCILMTASDAHMRDFDVACPQDCIASGQGHRHERTLEHLADALRMSIVPSEQLDLAAIGR
jgi:nicotinamidase-related amidase